MPGLKLLKTDFFTHLFDLCLTLRRGTLTRSIGRVLHDERVFPLLGLIRSTSREDGVQVAEGLEVGQVQEGRAVVEGEDVEMFENSQFFWKALQLLAPIEPQNLEVRQMHNFFRQFFKVFTLELHHMARGGSSSVPSRSAVLFVQRANRSYFLSCQLFSFILRNE